MMENALYTSNLAGCQLLTHIKQKKRLVRSKDFFVTLEKVLRKLIHDKDKSYCWCTNNVVKISSVMF